MFTKISITKGGVELDLETQVDDKNTKTEKFESTDGPLPSFRDSLQAFAPYVSTLLELPDEWLATLKVTTLNISKDKNKHIGLIVTAIRPVKKAYDKPLVLNTPLVREGGENPSPDAFVLSDEVLALVEDACNEAAMFRNGEREQLELIPKRSENSDNFNDNAAAASAKSTRKPKGKKPQRGSDEELREQMLKKRRDVPLDAIARWTSSDRDGAMRWAIQPDLPAEGENSLPMPECVQRDGTLSIFEPWGDEQPVRVDEAGVHSITDAARGD